MTVCILAMQKLDVILHTSSNKPSFIEKMHLPRRGSTDLVP
jgi:hypothetical protein